MGIRFRRTVQLLPGLRVGLTGKGASLRVGPQGAGYTINTKGEQRVSAGLPGTGLHVSERIGGVRQRRPKAVATEEAPRAKGSLALRALAFLGTFTAIITAWGLGFFG